MRINATAALFVVAACAMSCATRNVETARPPQNAGSGEVAQVAEAVPPARLTGLQLEQDQDVYRLVMNRDRRTEISVMRMDDPVRVVIDITGCKASDVASPLLFEGKPIAKVTVNDFGADGLAVTRIVAAFDQPVNYAVVEEESRVLLNFSPAPAIGQANEPATEAAVARTAEIAQAVAQPREQVEVGLVKGDLIGNDFIATIGLSKGSLDPAGYQIFMVDEPPPRLVVDIPNAAVDLEALKYLFDSPVVSRIRVGAHADKTRLVFDLKIERPSYSSLVNEDGSRLVVRLSDTSGEVTAAAVPEARREPAAGSMITLPATSGSVAAAVGAKFTGQRISLELKDTDIHDLLRLIADVSKLNIVTTDEVVGKVTVRLLNVPWDQALDIILKSKSLGMEKIGNIIRVAPLSTLQKEKEIALAKKKSQEALEPLSVKLIPVSYSTAEDLIEKVKDLLSPRGTVNFDERTNVIIVKDIQEVLVKAEALVEKLDLQTPQVMIESRIVEADIKEEKGFGIQWGGSAAMSPAYGNPTGLVFPYSVGIAGGAGALGGNNPGLSQFPSYAVNLPLANTYGSLGFTFGSVGNAVNLNLRLSAMESLGRIHIVSAPKITTLDNKEAMIKQGMQIPVTVLSTSGVPTTKMVNAEMELKVTPHITADGSVLMKLAIKKNEPDWSRTNIFGEPAIITKEAETEILVKTGDTSVIGGIFTKKQTIDEKGVPFFSRIPILGWLFKSRTSGDEKTELLIFLTPRIINRASSSVGSQQ